jgi:hypothetical protein
MELTSMTKDLRFAIFLINESPNCIWDYELAKTNKTFLTSIDPSYYRYIAETFEKDLENSDKDIRYRASLALRASFYQALETFFLLVGAMVQAPECEYAYVLKASTSQVKLVANRIETKTFTDHCFFLDNDLTWQEIARIIFEPADHPTKQHAIIKFSECWSLFAKEFCDPLNTSEYNSLKHGLRVSPGGFNLFKSKTKLADDLSGENRQHVGGNEYGSSFFVKAPIDGSKLGRKDPHFTSKMVLLNWSPSNVVNALKVLSYSIRNIASYLCARNKLDFKFISFQTPGNIDYLLSPWSDRITVLNSTVFYKVKERQVTRHSRNQMLKMIEKMKIEKLKVKNDT